ncbi:MAG: DUF1311 domain-containing protein [Hyphomonadaceae bacterium]|nr:DUF1311 domain-containing protein [Hyphomonadaceae bacterium]
MKGFVVTLAALACLAGPASAQPAQQDPAQDVPQLRACAVAAGLGDPEKLEACERPILRSCNDDYALCYNRLFTAWDGLLNASFRELSRTGVLERRDARNLQSAQRAWIKFRDEDCDFYAGVWPGSRPPGQLAACRHRETRERAAVLTVRLEAAKKLRP